MIKSVLVTGSAGLVGTAVCSALRRQGILPIELDPRAQAPAGRGDVRDAQAVARAIAGCAGVIHLAAVSRVVWGEQDPELCRATNIDGTRNVLEAARQAPMHPWVIVASSREVYGEAEHLPANEDTRLSPLNVYAETKVAAERLTDEARSAGLRTAIVRLSNVYGSVSDHADRVIPAFARGAPGGTPLRVDGADHTFDFTHVDDTQRGILAVMSALGRGEARLPPIHFVTGNPTTLGQLAELAMRLAGTNVEIVQGPTRDYDVVRFYGDPKRARELLGWRAEIDINEGMARLIREFGIRPPASPRRW